MCEAIPLEYSRRYVDPHESDVLPYVVCSYWLLKLSFLFDPQPAFVKYS